MRRNTYCAPPNGPLAWPRLSFGSDDFQEGCEMTRRFGAAATFGLGVLIFGAGVGMAAQGWFLSVKAGPGSRSSVLTVGPRAAIGSDANGIYCASPAENGVGVHDLGAIPSGLRVVVTVESYSDNFNPVAAVVVPTLGEKAANNVRLANFYDNDSGGDGDARVDFVAPQSGVYILLVGDFTDKTAGCYRYQVLIG